MGNLKKAGFMAGTAALVAFGIAIYTLYLNRSQVEIISFIVRTGNISDFERGCLASSQRIEKTSEDRLKFAEENGIRPRPILIRYSRQLKTGLAEEQYRNECQSALLKGGTINFKNRARLGK